MDATTFPVFLGTCLHAVKVQLGWDLSRVSNFILVPFFPIRIPDIALVVALPLKLCNDPAGLKLNLISARREQLLTSIEIVGNTTSEVTQEIIIRELHAAPEVIVPPKQQKDSQPERIASAVLNRTASHMLFVIPCPGFQVVEPSQIRVDCVRGDDTLTVGAFSIEFLKTKDLDAQEIRDIRKRGRGIAATIQVSCKQCKKDVVIYKSLAVEATSIRTTLPQIAVESLPDEYVCGCGETRFDTRFLKIGMHEIFRHQYREGENAIKLASCYTQTAIATVVSRFRKIIDSTPSEEVVQAFLTQNPIMWSFLGPLAIQPKPRLSTHLTADFAILTPTKTLFFVEIEKPQTKLAKLSGGQAAELQAGKDQIDTWRIWIGDHRSAVLDELRISADQVHQIKYILVAGLESATKPDDLRAVREGIKEDTHFYTFDELAGYAQNLDAATRHM
jgi:hypothetical protein